MLITLSLLALFLVTLNQINNGVANASEEFSKTIDSLTQLMCDIAFPWVLDNHMQFIDPANTDAIYTVCNYGHLGYPNNYGQLSANITQELTHLLTGSCLEAANQVCSAPYVKQEQNVLSLVFTCVFGLISITSLACTGREYFLAGRSREYLSAPIRTLPSDFRTKVNAVSLDLKLGDNTLGHLDHRLKQRQTDLKTELTSERKKLKTNTARLVISFSPFVSMAKAHPTSHPREDNKSDHKVNAAAPASVRIEILPQPENNNTAQLTNNRL